MAAKQTNDETTRRTVALATAVGKTPVEANDYPGFIANRILMPMINEAVFCLMEGVGTAEAIDTVMKLGMNHPMGPLQLADFIGLDTCLAILDVLHERCLHAFARVRVDDVHHQRQGQRGLCARAVERGLIRPEEGGVVVTGEFTGDPEDPYTSGTEGKYKRHTFVPPNMYAILPIVRTTLAGLQTIEPAVREAGVAMGMTPGQLWGLVVTQTGLIGLAAGVLAAYGAPAGTSAL